MTPEAIAFAVLGVAGTALGLYFGRITAAKGDAANMATLSTKIETVLEAIREIKQTLKEESQSNSDSIRRLHDRIDEHERTYHRKVDAK